MANEHQEQSAFIKWCHNHCDEFPGLDGIFAIPNGGNRDVETGAMLKREGVKAGVPDLMLPVMKGSYGGLFIEMKQRDKGRLSAKQKLWRIFLLDQGYLAVKCNGAKEASEVVKGYYL